MVIIILVLITLNAMMALLHLFTGMWWWIIIHVVLAVVLFKQAEDMF